MKPRILTPFLLVFSVSCLADAPGWLTGYGNISETWENSARCSELAFKLGDEEQFKHHRVQALDQMMDSPTAASEIELAVASGVPMEQARENKILRASGQIDGYIAGVVLTLVDTDDAVTPQEVTEQLYSKECR